MTTNLRYTLSLVALALTSAHSAKAQRLPQDTDVVRLAEGVKTRQEKRPAIEFLLQTSGPQPRAKLDALTNAMVEIAVAGPRRATEIQWARIAAVEVLTNAALSSDVDTYTRAASGLLRIAIDTTVIGEQGGAVYMLSELADRRMSIRCLAEVAASHSTAAVYAVRYLLEKGSDGLPKLRELYQSKTVSDREAKNLLKIIASSHPEWK